MTENLKKENLMNLEKRLTGWQLENFKGSYQLKKENDVSLFKKN
tara:strand:- start:306 stop:437 length:132 start_codon:yes stop_codon:yes gene_type:complete